MKVGRSRLAFRVGLGVSALVLGVTVLQALAMRTAFLDQSLDVRRHVVEEGVALARLTVRGEGVNARVLREEVGPLTRIAVVFYDEDGHLLARSRDEVEIVGTLDDAMRAGAIAERGAPYYLTPLGPGTRTAVIASSGSTGPVRFVGLYEDSTVLAIAHLRTWVPLTISAIALVTALIVTWLLSRRIRRAVLDTELVVRRMAQGDLSLRLPGGGADEVGDLIGEFNRMVDHLAARLSRLESEEQRRRALFSAFTADVQVPLTALFGHLESSQMSELEPERYLELAQRQAQEVRTLVEGLSTLCRLENDGIALDRIPHELAKVAEQEAEALGPLALRCGVTVRIEGGSAVAPVDRARFGQALRALIDSAIRRAPRGSAVEVVVRDEDKSIEVIDEGTEELGPSITAAPPAAEPRGRALALAIARGLVEAHGGELTVQASEGKTRVRATVGRVR